MSNYLSYDIEIYNELPEGERVDFSSIIPSVGAFCTTEDDTEFFYDDPYMTRETAKKLVCSMMDKYLAGFIPFTWNGLSFDYQLLSTYSGMVEECSILALNHVDAMFIVVCKNGYFLGLDAALRGAGLESKVHNVTLNNGMEFSTMSGAEAPRLWREGEFSAVKTYLKGDVVQPLKLARNIEKSGSIRWTSKSGKPMLLRTQMFTVKQCLSLEKPDTSWMSNPKPREEFYSWIPSNIFEKEIAR